jgi:hypothetical protein
VFGDKGALIDGLRNLARTRRALAIAVVAVTSAPLFGALLRGIVL